MRPIFIRIPKTASQSIKSMGLFSLLKNKNKHHTHVPAIEYDNIKDRIAFCVVRNPFDRLASSFHHIKQIAHNRGAGFKHNITNYKKFIDFVKYESFENFILDEKSPLYKSDHPHFKTQAYWICDINDNILVSHILKYENLDYDWEHFLNNMGIDFIPLPNLNTSKNKKDFMSCYDQEMALKIYGKYKIDFDLFGYKF